MTCSGIFRPAFARESDCFHWRRARCRWSALLRLNVRSSRGISPQRVGSAHDPLWRAKLLINLKRASGAGILPGPVARPRYHRIEANGPSGAVLLWGTRQARRIASSAALVSKPLRVSPRALSPFCDAITIAAPPQLLVNPCGSTPIKSIHSHEGAFASDLACRGPDRVAPRSPPRRRGAQLTCSRPAASCGRPRRSNFPVQAYP